MNVVIDNTVDGSTTCMQLRQEDSFSSFCSRVGGEMGVCNFELRYDGDLLCEESFGMVLPESELELWPTKEGEARAHLQKLGIKTRALTARTVMRYYDEEKYDIAILIIESGVSPDEVLTEAFDSFHTSRSIELVSFLFNRDVDVDARDDENRTALICAAQSGCREVAQLLLDNEADVNAHTKQGTTALMAASYEGHTDIVEILLNAGVEIDKRDLLGQTALVQSMYGTYADIADMLLIHGASIDAKTKDGNTALMAAVYLGSTSIVQMLIDKHADVNCKNSAGRTPIFLASGVKNNHAIVSMLMKNDADPNMCDDTGATPLSSAASMGLVETVDILLVAGATINVQDTLSGSSPLHLAIAHGKIGVVTRLLEGGALLEVVDKAGMTPTDVAVHNEQELIIKILKREQRVRSEAMKRRYLMAGIVVSSLSAGLGYLWFSSRE